MFTVAQLLVPFVSLVIFDAVLRYGLAKNADKKSVLKSSLVVVLIGSLVTVIVTPAFILYKPLSEWRWYLCIYVILTMLGNVELNYLKMIDKNNAYAIISVLHTLVLAVANVVLLANLHWGIRGYLIATILGSATTVVLSDLILNNVSWWVIQSSDKIMIEAMVGPATLGLYTAATKIPSLINVIISIFSQAWGISSIREFESTNDKSFYSDVFVSFSVIGFGASVCINVIVKPFMSIYVSKAFAESWRFVPLLLVSASFSAVASYFGSLYGALKKSVNNMCSTLCAAVINIIVNYLCILWLGAWGAIIGTVIAYSILALYRMIDVLRFIKFDPHWKVFLLNSSIVITQAILVSLDFHIMIVSIISVVVFAFVNRKTIIKMVSTLIRVIRRK